MAWLNINKAPLIKGERREIPEGLWVRCHSCGEILYRRDFVINQNTCHKCKEHYFINARERIHNLLDPESFVEFDKELSSIDPLIFSDVKPYKTRLIDSQKKTQMNDALLSGQGQLFGKIIQIAVFDFAFMGGSMGVVVGEKILRAIERARKNKHAIVIFSASGGARMQEGLLSLMQMAKTCAALARLKDEGLPFISILTNPTTGGVAASYAMLGDINIAEPGALIGFAGPRVIRQTIGEDLPEGFQTAEYLLEHGMLDFICERKQLRKKLSNVLKILI